MKRRRDLVEFSVYARSYAWFSLQRVARKVLGKHYLITIIIAAGEN